MRRLEEFLKPTQKSLFKRLRVIFKREQGIVSNDMFILVEGEVPIMLLAHLDTVHRKPVKEICTSEDGNILMSPQGIGGDDRCGVYAIVTAYEKSLKKPWLLFTCDEEIGGVGASNFCEAYDEGKLPEKLSELKMLVEIDRKGSDDAVYYDCDNSDFEAYITSKGFQTAVGSFSDISLVAPKLGVAAVNLSSAYYNPHQLHEYINRKELENVTQKVIEIVADVAQKDFPKYKYVERIYKPLYRTWRYSTDNLLDDIAADFDSIAEEFDDNLKKSLMALSHMQKSMYLELLDFYTAEELESLRKEHGDSIIQQIYNDEVGMFYGDNLK